MSETVASDRAYQWIRFDGGAHHGERQRRNPYQPFAHAWLFGDGEVYVADRVEGDVLVARHVAT